MVKVRITEEGTIEAKAVTIVAGYAFCSVCGGLFKLDGGLLPTHVAVGRGNQMCLGGIATFEGEVSL
jgi:hypothetical protein